MPTIKPLHIHIQLDYYIVAIAEPLGWSCDMLGTSPFGTLWETFSILRFASWCWHRND